MYRQSPARTVATVRAASLAVGETVILLHPPVHLAGVSIAVERERQQNDSLANGCASRNRAAAAGSAVSFAKGLARSSLMKPSARGKVTLLTSTLYQY